MHRIALLLLLAPVLAGATVIGPGGRFIAMTRGADGLPVIAYANSAGGTGGLQVAKCADDACNAFVTRPVDTQGIDAWYVAIAVGTDGLPAIAYHDLAAGSLRFVKCGDPACSTGNVGRTIDGGGGVNRGQYASIAVTSDNRAAISYFDASVVRLRYSICSDATCSSNTSSQLPTQDEALGEFTSMVMGPGNVPNFTYQNVSNNGLNLFRCVDGPACTSVGNFFVQVNACSLTGRYNSLALGSDGLPVISYYNGCIGTLNIAKCADAFCSSNTLITTIGNGAAPLVGRHTSIAIGTDGNPLVAYYDFSNQTAKLLRCGGPTCQANNTAITVAPVGAFADALTRLLALVVNAAGKPLLAYWNAPADELNVVEVDVGLVFRNGFE